LHLNELELLSSAYLVSGLGRWSPGRARLRASSPKLVIWSNALVNAMSGQTYRDIRRRPDLWGRLVENAVGAWLLGGAARGVFDLYYWRDGADEVDFVMERGQTVVALEVKSGRARAARGLEVFRRRYPRARGIVIGSGGVPLEDFFSVAPSGGLQCDRSLHVLPRATLRS